jgi:hypothetical protein
LNVESVSSLSLQVNAKAFEFYRWIFIRIVGSRSDDKRARKDVDALVIRYHGAHLK